MPKFIIYSSETVLYETIIEAPTESEALARFDIDPETDTVDRVGWQTDDIQEVFEDESI